MAGVGAASGGTPHRGGSQCRPFGMGRCRRRLQVSRKRPLVEPAGPATHRVGPSAMNDEDSKIKTRLGDVLNSILCPVVGCWPLHGGHSEYYFDPDVESHE